MVVHADDGSQPSRRSRPVKDTAPLVNARSLHSLSLALVVLLATSVLGTGALGASPQPVTGLDAPIRAFGWPADGDPNDPFFSIQPDLDSIAVASAWARTTGASSVVVAVLDTGLDASNAEFAGRVVPGFNALTGIEDGAGAAATDDVAGHGTHVSGTIAAAAHNGAGIAGIAPGVRIMPIKVLDDNGEGDFGAMVDGLDWALDHGARIVTMSLGGTLEPAAIAAIQPFITAAHNRGAVLVAASGNDGSTINEYPCNFTYVICVGSTTTDGTAVSSFSTRSDGVALVAPGERIASTLPGGGYGYGTGTSMATPHVTGAVALLRSYRPAITPDEVFAALTGSALQIGAGGRNPASGFGLLQVGPALDRVAGGPAASPSPSPSPTASPSPTGSPDASPTPGATPSPSPLPSVGPLPTPELIVPAVTAASPRNGQRSVSRSIRPRVTFSVPVAGISTSTIRMKDLSRGRWVTIRVSYRATTRVATITPTTRLASNHSYRITVGVGVTTAAAGTPLARPYVFTFRTGDR